ncbi:MAG TPA: hypothetical protein VLA50_10990 [Erythrobacter sp.]|nr:hypothetical protein [Erythrobacter sp.]
MLFGLIFMLACLSAVVWIFAQHVRRGWKDHIWVWHEANDGAIRFAVLFGILAGAKWLVYDLKDEAIIYAGVGLVFVALPYVLYIIGRFLGMWHRSRHGTRLS